jgi:transposase-like protein
METALRPVQDGRSRKRRWPAEQKLAVLREWRNGASLEEVCRKYGINAAQMYRCKGKRRKSHKKGSSTKRKRVIQKKKKGQEKGSQEKRKKGQVCF